MLNKFSNWRVVSYADELSDPNALLSNEQEDAKHNIFKVLEEMQEVAAEPLSLDALARIVMSIDNGREEQEAYEIAQQFIENPTHNEIQMEPAPEMENEVSQEQMMQTPEMDTLNSMVPPNAPPPGLTMAKKANDEMGNSNFVWKKSEWHDKGYVCYPLKDEDVWIDVTPDEDGTWGWVLSEYPKQIEESSPGDAIVANGFGKDSAEEAMRAAEDAVISIYKKGNDRFAKYPVKKANDEMGLLDAIKDMIDQVVNTQEIPVEDAVLLAAEEALDAPVDSIEELDSRFPGLAEKVRDMISRANAAKQMRDNRSLAENDPDEFVDRFAKNKKKKAFLRGQEVEILDTYRDMWGENLSKIRVGGKIIDVPREAMEFKTEKTLSDIEQIINFVGDLPRKASTQSQMKARIANLKTAKDMARKILLNEDLSYGEQRALDSIHTRCAAELGEVEERLDNFATKEDLQQIAELPTYEIGKEIYSSAFTQHSADWLDGAAEDAASNVVEDVDKFVREDPILMITDLPEEMMSDAGAVRSHAKRRVASAAAYLNEDIRQEFITKYIENAENARRNALRISKIEKSQKIQNKKTSFNSVPDEGLYL